MKKSEIIKNKETIGMYTLCNYGGLLIKDIDSEKITFYNAIRRSAHTLKLYYSDDDVYFKYYNIKISINDIMRV